MVLLSDRFLELLCVWNCNIKGYFNVKFEFLFFS